MYVDTKNNELSDAKIHRVRDRPTFLGSGYLH